MLGLYKSHQNTHFKHHKKEISIDKYDTDSEEEDQRREQAEIKQIINNARIKNAAKFKVRNLPTSDRQRVIQAKFDALGSPNNNLEAQSSDSKGFFSHATSQGEGLVKRDFDEEMRRLAQPKPKVEIKSRQTQREIKNGILGAEKAFEEIEKSEQRTLVNKVMQPRKKVQEVPKNPKDIEFQKESFNGLLSFYSKSNTKNSTKFVPHRPNLPNKNANPFKIDMHFRKDPVDASLQISYIANAETSGEDNVEQGGIEVKDFQELVPELVSAVLVDAFEALDKKNPGEIPRFKSMDWPEMMKKIDSNKLELLIMDPINFTVEDCLEISSGDPEKVKDIMNEAIKEVTPGMNEAKHILVYYYEKSTDKKKLLFSKFIFFVKNHKTYQKGFRNEKEVIAHYLIILALLEFRMAYETNPFKDDKVENSKKKAFNIFKGTEPFTTFMTEWLANKIQTIISVEKVYINLNVGGKADSNFIFNIHEHLCYSFPKFSQFLTNKLRTTVSLKSINTIEKATGSDLNSRRETGGDIKETISNIPSAKELKFSPRITEKSNYLSSNTIPKKKSENTQNYNESNTPSKKPTSAFYHGHHSSQLLKSSVTSPINNKFANPGSVMEGYSNRMESDLYRAMASRSMSLSGQGYFGSSPRINRIENKVYLSNNTQRMNTSYGQLLKQRFGNKFL